MVDYLPADGMVPSNHKLTFYRDYAFVLYIEIGSYHNGLKHSVAATTMS